MPAGASATRRSARGCWPARTRRRRRASRCCSTGSTRSGARSRRRCSKRRWRRPTRWSTARPDLPLLLVGSARLAQGRRRARREPPDRALPPPGVRHRLGATRAGRRGHRLAALGRGRRHRLGGARSRGRRPSRQGRRPRHGGRPDGRARDKLAALRGVPARTSSPRASARRATRDGLDIDGALTPAGVTDELLDLIERVGPLRPGQSGAALCLSGDAREVRQGRRRERTCAACSRRPTARGSRRSPSAPRASRWATCC